MSQGLCLTHAGLLLDWTVGAAALSVPLLFKGLPLNVQLQPDCIKNSLLKGEFGGVANLGGNAAVASVAVISVSRSN